MNFCKLEKRKEFWFLYTLFFTIISVIIFLPFIIKGNSFIRDGDGFNQTYPVLIYIGKYLRELWQGGFNAKNFDFTLGLGEDVITSLTWLGFGDVFTILSAFCPAEMAAYLFSFIVLLKMYCSGAAFAAYGFYHGFRKNAILLGSLLYAFNKFSLVMGMEFYQTLNPVVWLPLFALGIDKLLVAKKKTAVSSLFIFTVFIQSLNGFYFLYVNTIFCAIYYIAAYWVVGGKECSFLDFCKKSLQVTLNYILGIMMGAFVFIPAIVGYFGSSRTERSFQSIRELLFYQGSTYLTYLKWLLIPRAWQQCLSLPAICILGVIIMLSKKYNNKFIKLLVGLFLLMFLIPFTGSLMNGFSYSIDRWSFMIYFCCAVLVMDILNSGVKLQLSKIILYCAIAVLTLGMQAFYEEEKIGTVLRILVYAVLVFSSVIFCLKYCAKGEKLGLHTRKEIWLVSLWVMANIILNGLFINGPVTLGGDGYSAGFCAYRDVYRQIENSVANGFQNEEGFYRVDVYDSSLGGSLVLDYKGATQYFSITNDNIFEFFKQMSISPGIRSASHIIKGLDSRLVMETLLSAKYYQEYRATSDGKYEPYIMDNPYALPFGFTYSSCMSKDAFDNLTELQKMQVLLENVVMEESFEGLEIKNALDEDKCKELKCSYSLENINIDRNKLSVDTDSLIFIDIDNIPIRGEGELYIRLNDLILYSNTPRDIQIGNKNIQLRSPQSLYYIGENDFLVKVSVPKNGRVEIGFTKQAELSLDSIQVFWYDMNEFPSQVVELEKEHLENLNVENGKITGSINVVSDKVLFLSIPYSSGWKARVDGSPVKIQCANIGFMAIPLEAGEHFVELVYITPGMREGIMLSILGIVLFAVLLIGNQKAGAKYEN